MGAAWRNARNTKDFERIIDIVKEITSMDMEVCCTLGMLSDEKAAALKEAGLYAYNHNFDSSEGFYNRIISTRKYQDRLDTLNSDRENDISIMGMGENDKDRIKLIYNLATMPTHPESVPINALIAVEGTPMENQPKGTLARYGTYDRYLAYYTMPHDLTFCRTSRYEYGRAGSLLHGRS